MADSLSLAQMTSRCMSVLRPHNSHPPGTSVRRQWTRLAMRDTLAGCSPHKENTTSCSCRSVQCCPTLPIFLPYHNLLLRLLTSCPQPLVLIGTTVISC